MLKVLVCDDELNICNLVVRLIRWEQLEMELVGIAQNGRDAMDLIIEQKPDIVLTDIRMPVYNGLELAVRAQQLGIGSRFVVISGYSNFSYAQDALKASVADYLLKPINAQELNDVMERVAGQIRQERDRKNIMENIEDRLQNMVSAEREIFIKNVILGNASAYSPAMLKACGLQFTGNCYGSFMVAYDLENDDAEAAMLLKQQMTKLQDKVRINDYPSLRELLFYQEEQYLYGIFNYADNQMSVVRAYLSDIYYTFRRFGTLLPGLHTTLAVGKTVYEPAFLSESVQSSRDAIHCRINLGTDSLLFYDELPPLLLQRPRLDSALISKLRSCLDLCDMEAISNVFQGLFADTGAAAGSYFKLAYELLNFIQKEQSASTIDYSIDEPALYENACAALETVYKPCQISEILLAYCRSATVVIDHRGVTQADRAVELAKKYIAENYGGECALQDVANYAHLSANYLSSTFKKKVGVSMNTYITVTRINEAKRLLKETDDDVYDIGEHVGYRDQKHFRKVFKENVGISPIKYRSLYR